MLKAIARTLALALALSPGLAGAEPIMLKLSFFTSDRSVAYLSAVKPFVDAVNLEGNGIVRIEVHLSGSLGRIQRELPQQVLDRHADIAFIVPGQNPELFRDNTAVELPGLFRDVREATLVYTRLVAADMLAGYRDFFVIGAFATEPESVHSRKPLAVLADLKGQKIRANNLTEAAALARLGALPAVLAFNETSAAISGGMIDGATVPVAQLFDVGIGRLVSNHYLLQTSVAPLTLMMNRAVYDALPDDAKAIIRRHSGEWAATAFIAAYAKIDADALAQLKSDARRRVVAPSPADLDTAGRIFRSIAADWAADNAHNRELLRKVTSEMAAIRNGN